MNIRYIVRTSDNIVIEIQNSRSPNADEYIIEDVRYLSPLQDVSGVYLYEVQSGIIVERSSSIILGCHQAIKISSIKHKANEVILARYPEWKQTNMIADRQNALGVIAKLKTLPTDAVQNELVDKLMGKNATQLKAIRTDFTILNIDNLVVDIPADYKQEARNQYKVIGLSYIAWFLTNKVRKWSDNKELAVNECTSIDQIDSISLEDYPEI